MKEQKAAIKRKISPIGKQWKLWLATEPLVTGFGLISCDSTGLGVGLGDGFGDNVGDGVGLGVGGGGIELKYKFPLIDIE